MLNDNKHKNLDYYFSLAKNKEALLTMEEVLLNLDQYVPKKSFLKTIKKLFTNKLLNLISMTTIIGITTIVYLFIFNFPREENLQKHETASIDEITKELGIEEENIVVDKFHEADRDFKSRSKKPSDFKSEVAKGIFNGLINKKDNTLEITEDGSDEDFWESILIEDLPENKDNSNFLPDSSIHSDEEKTSLKKCCSCENWVKLDTNMVYGIKANQNELINISNMRGNITINTWDYDSVKVEAFVSVCSFDSLSASKMISKFKLTHKKNLRDGLKFHAIHYKTERGKRRCKKIFKFYDGDKITINRFCLDYIYTVPKRCSLIVNNMGYKNETIIAEKEGLLDVSISNGNLKMGEIHDSANILIINTKAQIEKINKARISMHRSELKMNDSAKMILFRSTGSKAIFKNVTNMTASLNYSELYVDEIDVFEVSGRSNNEIFTRKLNNVLNCKSGAKLKIAQIDQNFDSVSVLGIRSNACLNFMNNSCYELNVDVTNSKINFDENLFKEVSTEKQITKKTEKFRFNGKTNNYSNECFSKVDISGLSQKVEISTGENIIFLGFQEGKSCGK